MIRFIFWFIISVIMAYFMTDIKIGGKTIKENIDNFLKTQSGIELQEKAKSYIHMGLGEVLKQVDSNPPKSVEPVAAPNGNKDSNTQDLDDLRPEDARELQKIIKEHD
ncbi:MAG: hypothetical protein ACD_73C00256G0002 [uncultured bacterium]|nr:MAG: hypothetical protein ACD_73C00256G0002 [uncultured bacterium]